MVNSVKNRIKKKKADRRKNRTRGALRDALLALILEQGYDTVKVEEITERANLGRTTFYLHYRDKEELFLETIQTLVADLIDQISQIPISAWSLGTEALHHDTYSSSEAGPAQPILLTFNHAAENADLYRIILRGEGATRAVQRLRSVMTQAIADFFMVKEERENLTINPMVSMEVFANYLAGAWLGTITWWLEQDMPFTAEEMTRMFQKMLFHGAREVLGISLE
jgi:AcrR family transcriptional regulator